MTIYNLISFLGLFGLMLSAYVFSWNRKIIHWKMMFWGVGLQLLFGFFIFTVPAGVTVFQWVNEGVRLLIDSSTAGVRFVFGRLALPPGATDEFGQESIGFILAFQALPTIIFFSALTSVLYYYNILPRIIRLFAAFFSRIFGISGAESLCVTSNVFVGVESALTVKPYLARMTLSELGTVLTAMMATVSSNVLAIYVFSLQNHFPGIAGHLVSASVLSAPASLVIAKLMMPETGSPVTLGQEVSLQTEKDSGLFEALTKGANTGLQLMLGIAALLIAVLGLLAVTDKTLAFIINSAAGFLGSDYKFVFTDVLAVIFYPFVLMTGVPLEEAFAVSGVIGERLLLTEVASYMHLASLAETGVIKDPRSLLIASYALCGFAHAASLAIFTGGLAAIIPERLSDIGKVSLRSLYAATLATLMTAAVAGIFYTAPAAL